jgi:tRNA threonylcarbamoyladenosine biosynthesis protein TsaE
VERIIRESRDAGETYALGKELGLKASPGDIYALTGDLGTGKTVFAQGFAEGLGINDTVNSPTFTILKEYEGGRLPFYHFDVYRIEEPEEMYEVGLSEYLTGNGVCLIEWAELIEELLPEETVHIEIRKDLGKGEDFRYITIGKEERA